MARGLLATAAAFLRSSAEQNAFEGGAVRVRNRLTVRGRGRFPY